MKSVEQVGWVLVVVGALNWGLVGLGGFLGGGNDWNVVNMVLGGASMLEDLVYVLVGASGVRMLVNKMQK